MRIINLNEQSDIYTANAFLVTGDWQAPDNVNTLIDAGCDPFIIDRLDNFFNNAPVTGVDQVIVTHHHNDHTGMLKQIKAHFHPVVFSFADFIPEIDYLVKDGTKLKIGDLKWEILHTPGHSDDSICIYCPYTGDLFAGDTPIVINSVHSSYAEAMMTTLEKLAARDIKTIYVGHGRAMTDKCNRRIQDSLKQVKNCWEEYLYYAYER